jgi:hypothetical protein
MHKKYEHRQTTSNVQIRVASRGFENRGVNDLRTGTVPSKTCGRTSGNGVLDLRERKRGE